MSSVDNLLSVQNLIEVEPDMSSNILLGYRNQGKGESVYLNAESTIKFIGIIEFLPGLGVRGKHYHNNKNEVMYVLEGEMKGYYWLPDNPTAIKEVVHKKGDLITMKSGLVHAYEAVERTLAIELFPESYESDDNVYPNNFIKESE